MRNGMWFVFLILVVFSFVSLVDSVDGTTCSKEIQDGVCPSTCAVSGDADCCKQAGKCWFGPGVTGSPGCWDCNFVPGFCSATKDGICPSACSATSDADCCANIGTGRCFVYQDSTRGYTCGFCLDSTTSTTVPEVVCSPIKDGSCALTCNPGNDYDCCVGGTGVNPAYPNICWDTVRGCVYCSSLNATTSSISPSTTTQNTSTTTSTIITTTTTIPLPVSTTTTIQVAPKPASTTNTTLPPDTPLCSNFYDGSCSIGCFGSTDYDCCVAEGKCWYNGLCGTCTSESKICSATSDEVCPIGCGQGSDYDCCEAAGKEFYKGYTGMYGCYEKGRVVGSCQQVSDGVCPENCAPGSDVDCCTAKGYCWTGRGCDVCETASKPVDGNVGIPLACSTNPDGVCPGTCSAGSDYDCCKAGGKCWFYSGVDRAGCYDCTIAIGYCLTYKDGICPSGCAAGADYDCCQNVGKCWIDGGCTSCPSGDSGGGSTGGASTGGGTSTGGTSATTTTTTLGSSLNATTTTTLSGGSGATSSTTTTTTKITTTTTIQPGSTCETSGDGVCPSSCAAGADYDCCRAKGSCWDWVSVNLGCQNIC